ncbi:calcium/sodium antiporter [Thalassospira alkalitolerans]|uniref:calcium/sodium antiporter n=1 Tax=Thalassospira alkalitolerans TaxID=1293890 RepID=UPI001FE8AABE|nr:calcium/sodium antiporter [Thalassospira alkalitolerans]
MSARPHTSALYGVSCVVLNADHGGCVLEYLMVLGGLVGLFFGGEALVRGSVGIAQRMAMPPLLIGLTVVGFGTSTPELLVSVGAALRGVPDIALGNVIGSNIANILLIVGLSSLVWPIRVSGDTLKRDTAVMMVAAVVLIPVFALGEIGRVAGMILFIALVAYLVFAYRQSRKAPIADENDLSSLGDRPQMAMPVALVWVVGGLAALMVGADFMVDGAVTIARTFGVSEAFIGLTIVAVGTSLPELATSLIAALRKQSEIAIGNIVGSNIFNILGILGLTAVIAPIPVASRFITFDLPVMIAVSLVLTLLLRRPVIGRGIGIVMLIGYAGYVWSAR